MGWETICCVFILLVSITGGDAAIDGVKANRRFVTEPEIDFEAELIKLKAEFEAFKNNSQGSTFTRWGKNDCPHLDDFVYRGYIAGKMYNDPGSATDTLCLPTDPTWDKFSNTHEGFRAQVYGTELDSWASAHIFDKDVINEDMPCVVCRSQLPTSIMIPGRTNCYQGWTQQYRGYLVSNIAGAGRASYESICIDRDPDFLPHSQADDNQHVLYLMEAKCGSLPCPPYVDNRELACVVCSK